MGNPVNVTKTYINMLQVSNSTRKPPNPTGANGITNAAGWTNPAIRARELTNQYSSKILIKEAKLIAKGKDTQFSTQDAILVIQLANIFQCRDPLERERLYDRTFGKVPDKLMSVNLNLDANAAQLSDKALELMEKLSGV